MKDGAKITALRALCWAVVVILPTGIICWLAHIQTVAIIAVALPFMLVAERVFRKLLQVYGLWAPKTETEPSAPPNGGPTKPLGNSGVGGELTVSVNMMRPVRPEPAELPLIKKAIRAARFMKWGAPVVSAAALVLSAAIALTTVWYVGVVLLVIMWATLYGFGYAAARCPHCGQVWWSALGLFGAAPWGLMEYGAAAQEAETESFVCRRCHLDIGPALRK